MRKTALYGILGMSAALAMPALGNAASLHQCANIADYGASTGERDNTFALKRAISVFGSGNVCIYIPPGQYQFATPFTYLFNSGIGAFTLIGDGENVSTMLYTGSQGGINFYYKTPQNAVHIRDLAIITNTGGTDTGVALYQTAASNPAAGASEVSDFSNVNIRGGFSSPTTQYWGTAILVQGVSNVNFTGVTIHGQTAVYTTTGQGIYLSGTADYPAVQFNISHSTIQYVGAGVVYGPNVQGVSISQTNFTADAVGVSVPTNAGPGADQLAISDSQFNSLYAGIRVQARLDALLLHGNLFVVPNPGNGIQMDVSGLFSLVGNSFTGSSTPAGSGFQNGVVINNSQAPGIITNNAFFGLNAGVILQAPSQYISVQSNTFAVTLTPTSNVGSNNTVANNIVIPYSTP